MLKRFLIAGWAAFFASVVLALVFPRHVLRYLIALMIALGGILGPATLWYSLMFVYRQRMGRRSVPTVRPVERTLLAGWALFICATLLALLFEKERWVAAFGLE